MITWKEVVNNAYKAYSERKKYVYFYGAKGQVMTEARMDALINASPSYFARYSAEEIAQIKRNSLNKIGIDCSGFTGWICTGDKTYSTGQYSHRRSRTQDIKAGKIGSLVYTTFNGTGRHIGIDVGNGYVMDIGTESTDANIANGRAGIRLWKNDVVAWEWSFESTYVDYTGATADTQPFDQGPDSVKAVCVKFVDVMTLPGGDEKLAAWPRLGENNLVDVCDTIGNYSYIRIAAKHFGFVPTSALDVPKPATPVVKEYKVGDVVNFTGNIQYTSSYATAKSKKATACSAKVTTVAKGRPHPYHVVGKGVYGWVNVTHLK